MKYKITVEKIPTATDEAFEMALSCIVSALSLICPPATGEIKNASYIVVNTELTTCDEVKKSMRRLFSDASEELKFIKIEKID